MSNDGGVTSEPPFPIYLGDGAYAEIGHWPGQVCVYTTDGLARLNEVYLEIDMIDQLHAWVHGQKGIK